MTHSTMPDDDGQTHSRSKWKLAYKWCWRMNHITYGMWNYATIEIDAPDLLSAIVHAEHLIREMHPGCKTRTTHVLGRVDDASEGGAS